MCARLKAEDKNYLLKGLSRKDAQRVQILISLIEETDYTPMTDEEMKEAEARKEFAYHNNRLEGVFLDEVGIKMDESFDYYRVPIKLRSKLIIQQFLIQNEPVL